MKRKGLIVLIGLAAIIIAAVAIIMLSVKDKGHRVIKVESFSGDVVLERDDSDKEIFKNMNLKTEDIITTGKDGLIGLLVDDDKNIAAIENTCFTIISKGNEKKGALKIELKYGKSLIEIKNKLSDGSSFEVETPNASLSVKGTEFEVTYISEEKTTILKVNKGKVQAKSKSEKKMVKAGETAVIKDDSIELLNPDDNDDADKENIDKENADKEDTDKNPIISSELVKEEDWTKLLKGGSDREKLEYILEVVSRCEYEGEKDYIKDALYWMCDKEFPSLPPIKPIGKLSDTETVYDVAELNAIFSLLTEDTISEENLNPDINRLEGGRLICSPSQEGRKNIASAAIYEARYCENGEIVAKYAFNVVDIDTMEVDRFTKNVYLVADKTGKYVVDRIEEYKE